MSRKSSENDPLLASYTQSIGTWSDDASWSDGNERDIREKLEWYFKNPYQKFKERKRKPFKLMLQIVKIFLITAQAIIFAVDEFSLVGFQRDNIETFRQLFLLDYTGEPFQEVYLKEDLYKSIFFSWKQYYKYKELMIGSYKVRTRQKDGKKVQRPMELCVENSVIFQHETVVNNHTDKWQKNSCHYLKPPMWNETTTLPGFIEENSLPKNFETISNLKLHMDFQVNYTDIHRNNAPDCYQFNITVLFDNDDLDGTMSIVLDSKVDFRLCRRTSGIHIKERNWWDYYTLYDVIVILICLLSFILCFRSFQRHYKLCKDVEKFFCDYRHEDFTWSDKLNFVSFWLVLIVVSDCFTVAGSIIKIILDWLEYPELYDACSFSFGIAVMFSWIGILRYLGFMKGYNTLLVTLKTAFPSIVRFIFCCSFIYFGFTICGYIVFGPYHEKFRDLLVTSECLFALVNGDDMYTTFHSIDKDDSDPLIWYFSKIYLYVFISLFIYVVLSLFIGIVGDTYERIKDYGHPPKTRIELFMEGSEHHEPDQQHGGGCIHTQVGEIKQDYEGGEPSTSNYVST